MALSGEGESKSINTGLCEEHKAEVSKTEPTSRERIP